MTIRPTSIFSVTDKDLQPREFKSYSLMLKDKELLKVLNNKVTVLSRSKLPLTLRGKANISISDIESWILKRTLPITRENYKIIITSLGLDQGDELSIALHCKALSLIDCYWIKDNKIDETSTWDSVNLYKNKFSEAVAHLAFTGYSEISITGDYLTPELTNQGNFAKCWAREEGKLFLYKANTSNGKESEVEYLVSNLLEGAGINHVHYDLCNYNNRVSSRCENLTDDNMMIVPANHVIQFFVDLKKQPIEQIKILYGEEFNQMLVIDYIINNYDRHTYNWGFYMDAETGEVLGVHPLFDHNCSLDFTKVNAMSVTYAKKSLQEVALASIKELKNLDFIYNIFDHLKLETTKKQFNELLGSNYEWESVVARCTEIIKASAKR